ncbi:MAG: hypothetical protein ACREX5_15905, partial [Achromobacter pestifer]
MDSTRKAGAPLACPSRCAPRACPLIDLAQRSDAAGANRLVKVCLDIVGELAISPHRDTLTLYIQRLGSTWCLKGNQIVDMAVGTALRYPYYPYYPVVV